MLEILNKVLFESELTRKYFKEGSFDFVTVFSLTMLERLNLVSNGLTFLLDTINSNAINEFSCGILIRSVLSDYLILLNAIAVNLKDEPDVKIKFEKLDNFCLKYLSDSLKISIGNIELLYEGENRDNEKIGIYKNICKNYPYSFEPFINGSSKPTYKLEDAENSGKLYYKLKSEKALKAKAKLAYNLFSYYSKYDHFGITSYEYLRTPLSNRLELISNSVNLFPNVLYYSLILLNYSYPSDEFIKQQIERVKLLTNEL